MRQDASTGIRPQIEADVVLAVVETGVVRAAPAVLGEGRSPSACLVSGRCLDLDHLGAVVCQRLSGVRSGQYPAEIEDAQSGQCPPGAGVLLCGAPRGASVDMGGFVGDGRLRSRVACRSGHVHAGLLSVVCVLSCGDRRPR